MSLNNREFLIWKEIVGDRERWASRRVSRHAYLRLGLGEIDRWRGETEI
jgi:hypothetical protein